MVIREILQKSGSIYGFKDIFETLLCKEITSELFVDAVGEKGTRSKTASEIVKLLSDFVLKNENLKREEKKKEENPSIEEEEKPQIGFGLGAEEQEISIDIETKEYFEEVAKGIPIVTERLRSVTMLEKYTT